MREVVVIGGGPAGLTAAFRAASAGAAVTLLERGPRPGRKLLLTGGGRCNVTIDRDPSSFVRDCGPGGRFLHNALARLDPAGLRDWLRDLGVPTVREADGRCFPASGRALDVLKALESAARRAGVKVVTDARVESLHPAGGRLRVRAGGASRDADAVVLATGGRSYPLTGSSGDGHDLARAAGHRVVAPCPGEVPLLAGPGWIRDLAGLSVPDVVARFRQGDRRADARGDLLFAHFGVTGPVVMDGSRLVARWLADGPVELRLDLCPDRTEAQVDADLAAAARAGGNRLLRTLLRDVLPERLADRVASEAWPEGGPVARLPAPRRRAAAALLKGLPLAVKGTRGWEEAVVTLGGVDVAEVHPATMESRLLPGLHFAGEVLDLDGPRGGYNLQIAFSTGWVAGDHAGGG